MEFRRLGRSGAIVSEIALGSWLTAGGIYDEQNTIDIHLHARELGINFFDTADVYNRGVAETIVGKAIAQMNRDEIVVATKCHGGMGDSPNMRGLSKKHIIQACEASLKRLGVDYIDLYQFHRPDANTPLDESLRAIEQLLHQGKILYWGVSNFNTQATNDLLVESRRQNMEQPVSNQPKYNMFRRDIEETGLVDICGREGIGFIVYSPLEQGLLTGKYTSREDIPEGSRLSVRDSGVADILLVDYNFTAIRELQTVASDLGITMVQLSLAWILRKQEVSAAIVGATKIEHIDGNAAASGVTLDDAATQKIEKILDRRWARIKMLDHERILSDADSK